MSRLAVFAYGSLISPASAAQSLGRPVEPAVLGVLTGWRRRWSTCRDNLASEKTFALADGSVPPYVVGLNLERDPECTGANGALIEITEAEADRLDLRELRYDRTDVSTDVRPLEPGSDPLPSFGHVITYTAKPHHHAPKPPPGAVVIARYLRTVEAAFADLGTEQLQRFRETTDQPPVEPVEATLVADRIPAGNPREW